MRNRKIYIAVAVIAALCLSFWPGMLSDAHAATLEVGTGYAYSDLVSAINAASAGDTIVLKTDAMLQNGNEITLPYIIEKELTIRGDGTQTLTVRQNGILLNADVTLEGFSIDYTAVEINGIFANGHTLTYRDVRSVNTKNHIRLYAGGFHTGSDWLGTPGPHGQVIAEASSRESACVGMILGCGLSAPTASAMPWTVPSSVTVSGPVSFDPNYVSDSPLNSAALSDVMGWFPGEYSADHSLKHEPCTYATDTSMQIVLNDCGTVSVDGRSSVSAANAEVTVHGGQYQTAPTLAGVCSLTVAAGNVRPTVLERGAALAVRPGAILDLSAVMDPGYTAPDFAGGGILRVPNDSLLTVTGAVSGTTELQSIYYQSDPAASGIVTVGHTFIQTPPDTAADAFCFTPGASQPNVKLFMDTHGGWYTSLGQVSDTDASIEAVSLPAAFAEPAVGNEIIWNFYADCTPVESAIGIPLWYGGSSTDEDYYGATGDFTFADNYAYRLEIELEAGSPYCFRPGVLLPAGFSLKNEIPAEGCYCITIMKTYAFGTANVPADEGAPDTGTGTGNDSGSDNADDGSDHEADSELSSGDTAPVTPGDAGIPGPAPAPGSAEDTENAENRISYADVPTAHWGAEAISYVSSRGYFLGVSETLFAPEQPMTRQMLMTVLARVAGADTSGDAYAKGMAWAISAGISDGSAPLSPVSRQQLITMLYRYAGSPQVELHGLMARYADADQIADYALAAMAWATDRHILKGVSETMLAPTAPTTRAQVAAILMRFEV